MTAADPTDQHIRIAVQISREIDDTVVPQFVASVDRGTADPVLADSMIGRRVRELLAQTSA